MVVEIVCIVLQAARGTTSHYNISTAFDAAVFSTMGAMIGLNSALAALFLVLLVLRWRQLRSQTPPLYLGAVSAGLGLFLVGSCVGVMMVQRGAHAVGVADAGAGLPLLDWSREGGDLRIGHALGLHAIQVLPLLAWLLLRGRRTRSWRSVALLLATLAYAFVTLGSTVLALRGVPLVPL